MCGGGSDWFSSYANVLVVIRGSSSRNNCWLVMKCNRWVVGYQCNRFSLSGGLITCPTLVDDLYLTRPSLELVVDNVIMYFSYRINIFTESIDVRAMDDSLIRTRTTKKKKRHLCIQGNFAEKKRKKNTKVDYLTLTTTTDRDGGYYSGRTTVLQSI